MRPDRDERAAEDAYDEEEEEEEEVEDEVMKKINARSLVYFFRVQIPTKTNVTSTTNK